MKKEGKKIMCVAIIVIVLVIVAMVTAKNQKKTEVSGPDDVQISDLVYREEPTPIVDGEAGAADDQEKKVKAFISNYEKTLSDAEFITVEKVVRTIEEDTEGNYSTVYDAYLVSDINLSKKTDNTEEFAEAISAKEYDESLIKEVSFSDGFGFSYQGLNARGIYETLLDMEGFSGDLTEVTFDEETNALTGQNIYLLKNEGSVIEHLLPDYEEKDVIEKRVYFETTKATDTEMPDYFVAVIKYREGDKVIEKSIYLQIFLNEWKEA